MTGPEKQKGAALAIHILKGCAVAIVGFALSGCATAIDSPPRAWVAVPEVDRISGAVSCRVMPTAVAMAKNSVRATYGPIVEWHAGQLRVGIVSAGPQLPPGRIALRVDGNEAWTVETAETPIDFSKWRNRSMDQELSPVTEATGHKAEAILQQMRGGRVLAFRHSGITADHSSDGVIDLGPDFNSAVGLCSPAQPVSSPKPG